jgi:hypothetical protein
LLKIARLSAAALAAAVPFVGGTAVAQRYYPGAGGEYRGPAVPSGPTRAMTVTTTTVAPPPAPDATIANVAPPSAPGIATPIDAVFLRAGPSTDAPVIGTLEPGMPLHVLASANSGWMQVSSPAGSGWAYGSYLTSPGALPVR